MPYIVERASKQLGVPGLVQLQSVVASRRRRKNGVRKKIQPESRKKTEYTLVEVVSDADP